MATKILISTHDWQFFHPDNCNDSSDPYYAQLATRLARQLLGRLGKGNEYATTNVARQTAMWLTAYLEDKVSGLNIFNSFTSAYRKLMGRTFPFWDVDEDDLLPEEPSVPEVRFIIWLCTAGLNPGTFYSPLSSNIAMVADEMTDILTEAYEEAPEAERMRDWLYNADRYDDPVEMRKTCQWLSGRAYLTRINDQRCFDSAAEAMEPFLMALPSPTAASYQVVAYLAMNSQLGPMSMTAQQWLAEIMEVKGGEKFTKLADELRKVRTLKLDVLKIEAVNDDNFTVVNPAGDRLVISKRAFQPADVENLTAGGYLTASLYSYLDSWHPNGGMRISPSNPEADKSFDTLCDDTANMVKAEPALLKLNSGSRVGAVAGVAQLKELFGDEINLDVDNDFKCDNLLYFIEPDGDLTVIPDAAECVDFPGNAYYSPEKSAAEGLNLLIHPITTLADREYLISEGLLPEVLLPGMGHDEMGLKWMADNALFLALCTNSPAAIFNYRLTD